MLEFSAKSFVIFVLFRVWVDVNFNERFTCCFFWHRLNNRKFILYTGGFQIVGG